MIRLPGSERSNGLVSGALLLLAVAGACSDPRAGMSRGLDGGPDGPVDRSAPVATDEAGAPAGADTGGTADAGVVADLAGDLAGLPDARDVGPANPALPHRLEVFIHGDGRVEADDGSISCPGRCTAEFAQPRRLILKAVAGLTGNFSRWTESCSGDQPCTLDLNGRLVVTATFPDVMVWSKPTGRVTGVAVNGDDVYVVGYFEGDATFGERTATSVGERDVFLARFDAAGQVQMLKTFGGPGNDEIDAVAIVPGDEIVVTGHLTGSTLGLDGRVSPGEPNQTYAFLGWYSKTGELRRLIPGVNGLSLAVDAQGNVAIGGVPIEKYSPTGAKLWQANELYNRYLTPQMVFDGAGNLIVANTFHEPVIVDGRTHTPNGGSDVIVAKYTTFGYVAWSARVDHGKLDFPTGLTADANGDVFVAGDIYGMATSPDTRDAFVRGLSGADGSVRWMRTFIRPGYDRAGDVLADPAAGLFVAVRFAEGGDLDGGFVAIGPSVLRLDPATGARLSAKGTRLLPVELARHASGDLIAGEWNVARITVK